MISTDTLHFLRALVARIEIAVGAPDARALAAQVFRAQDEIDNELAERETD